MLLSDKLNPSKTEFMIIGNLTQRNQVANIFPVELLNQNFAETWVRVLIQFFHLRNMSRIFVDQLFSIFAILHAFEFI